MLREFDFNSSELKEKWKEMYFANPRLLPYASRRYSELFNKYFFVRSNRLFWRKRFYGLYNGENELLMILPLCIRGKELRVFCDFGNGEILDFIYPETVTSEHFAKLFAELSSKFQGYKLILNRLEPESLLHKWLQANNYQSLRQKSYAKLHLPKTYEEYLKSLSVGTRYNIRKKEKKIKMLDKPFRIEFTRGPISDVVKKECFRLYDQREAEREGRKRSFWSRYRRENFNALTDICTKEADSFNVCLYIGEKIVCFGSGLYDYEKKRLVSRKTGIDSAYDKYSPGIFLHTQTIKWLIENTEVEWFDLAGGREQYKYLLGCEEYFCHSYEIQL